MKEIPNHHPPYDKKLEKDKSKNPTETDSFESNFIREQVERITPDLVEIRRQIHRRPELGFQELETSQLVKKELEELGLEVDSEIAGTGVIGYLKGTEEGKTVAIRADMDALPVSEESGVDFSSTRDGVMHCCGHDSHTAAVLGAAEVLKQLKEQRGQKGDVIFIFQPNEERSVDKRSGAVAMIRHLAKKGIWEKIDTVLAFHAISYLPIGTVRLKNGLMLAGSSRFDLKVTGPGGHGARVHEVPNPAILGSEIVTGIAQKFGHTKPGEIQDMVVNPTFITGDNKESHNVIGRTQDIGGTVRVSSEENQRSIRQNIIRTIHAIAGEAIDPWTEHGAQYEFGFHPGTRPGIHRDPDLVRLAETVCRDIIGENVEFNRDVSPSGDDFTFYLEEFKGKQIPGIYFFLGAANSKKGIAPNQPHQPTYRIDEDVIPQATAILSGMSRRIQVKE